MKPLLLKILIAFSSSSILLLPQFGFSSRAQVLERNNTSFGNTKVFSYSVQSTYGATTSANASSNLIVDTLAVLNLKEDSYLTNTAGAVGGGTGAVFQNTPNGTNVTLTGITADNKFLIDNGTTFRAGLKTSDVDGQPSIGNASASASHTLTVTVTNGDTSFFNTLRENFESLQE